MFTLPSEYEADTLTTRLKVRATSHVATVYPILAGISHSPLSI